MHLTRKGKKILDHNIISLVYRDQQAIPICLEELVLEILEQPDLMMKQIVPHRYCGDMVYALFNIMNENTPGFPRYVFIYFLCVLFSQIFFIIISHWRKNIVLGFF